MVVVRSVNECLFVSRCVLSSPEAQRWWWWWTVKPVRGQKHDLRTGCVHIKRYFWVFSEHPVFKCSENTHTHTHTLFLLVMWTLRGSFFKHYGNVTFKCSLNDLKQQHFRRKSNQNVPRTMYTFCANCFHNIIKEQITPSRTFYNVISPEIERLFPRWSSVIDQKMIVCFRASEDLLGGSGCWWGVWWSDRGSFSFLLG